jgi:hypothetical protein
MKFAAGWGESLSSCAVSGAETAHPAPSRIALCTCSTTLPLQGRVRSVRGFNAELEGPIRRYARNTRSPPS